MSAGQTADSLRTQAEDSRILIVHGAELHSAVGGADSRGGSER